MSKVNKNATEHEFVTPDEEPAAKNNDCVLDGLTIQGAQQVNDVAAGETFDESLDSRAGNKPLQGVSKPPAKPVVMISLS